MQVARYWRNKKLRYRLVRSVRAGQHGDSVPNMEHPAAAEPKAQLKRDSAALLKR